MDIFNFSYSEFTLFVLVLVRISAILVLVPVFGSRSIPFQVKAGLSLLMTLVIYPLLKVNPIEMTGILPLTLAVLTETIIGMVIAYSSRLVFTGVQIAGHIVGFQMGYAIVNVFDPTTSSQVSIIAEVKYILAVLIFLSIGAHHWFILAIIESFKLIPMMGAQITGSLVKVITDLFGNFFIIAIKIAAPVMVTMMFINVSLGLIAKTVPQMNVFIVGFPVQIGIGLVTLALTVPIFYMLLVRIFNNHGKTLLLLLRTMS